MLQLLHDEGPGFMDCVGWSVGNESKSVEEVDKDRNECLQRETCTSICQVIPHSQYAIVHSSCPLPQKLMIGVLGVRQCDDSRKSLKSRLRKKLLDMLNDSEVILKQAIALEEQSRILLEDSYEEDVGPCGNDVN